MTSRASTPSPVQKTGSAHWRCWCSALTEQREGVVVLTLYRIGKNTGFSTNFVTNPLTATARSGCSPGSYSNDQGILRRRGKASGICGSGWDLLLRTWVEDLEA
jgi:hypothetical protein